MSFLSAEQWQAIAETRTDEVERLICELDAARRNADTARQELDRAHQALERIAARHTDDRGMCGYCSHCPDAEPFPCPDYLDATGATP